MGLINDSMILSICSETYEAFGDMNRGGCGVFARAMNEYLKCNEFLYVFDKDSLDEDPPFHVYLKLKQDKYLDIVGFHVKNEIYNYYGLGSILLEDDGNILDIHYDELGEGLFVQDYKPEYLIIKKFIFEKFNSQ